MSPGAAGLAAATGGELGKEFLRFFLLAVGAYRVFSSRVHGLQKHELFVASFAEIFIKRHGVHSF
jgi:hypothetical protein